MGNSYPFLAQIPAGPLRSALQTLFDQVGALKKGSQAQLGPPNMGGNRVTKVADPEEDDDAVTLRHLREQLAVLDLKISRRGIQNLSGKLPEPQIPFLRDIPAGPLPDAAVALEGEMIRHQGVLKFFNSSTRLWEEVITP